MAPNKLVRTNSPGYDNVIIAEHDVESHDTLLTFYSYAHFCKSLWALRCSYVKIKSNALISLSTSDPVLKLLQPDYTLRALALPRAS